MDAGRTSDIIVGAVLQLNSQYSYNDARAILRRLLSDEIKATPHDIQNITINRDQAVGETATGMVKGSNTVVDEYIVGHELHTYFVVYLRPAGDTSQQVFDDFIAAWEWTK